MYALLWSFGGDARLKLRENLGEFIKGITTIPLPSTTAMPVIDYEVCNDECRYVCKYLIVYR